MTPACLLSTLPRAPDFFASPNSVENPFSTGAPDAYVFVLTHMFKPTFASSRGSVVSSSECGE